MLSLFDIERVFHCVFQVMCSSWYSAWTAETPSMRCSAWSTRFMSPSPACETKPRRTWTSRWWSAATSVTETLTVRCRTTRSSSWLVETSTALTLKSQPRRTPTWTKCFRLSLPWPSCPPKCAPVGTARSPCSTARFFTESSSRARNAKTGTHMVLWRRLHGDPACTATWCTSRRRLKEAASPKRKAASYADTILCLHVCPWFSETFQSWSGAVGMHSTKVQILYCSARDVLWSKLWW